MKYISDLPDYRHLEDRARYKALYEEVGTLEANQEIRWRSEWMKHFQPHPNATILELGAHNGSNLFHYARAGHTMHGLELSSTLIEVFQRQLMQEQATIRERIRMSQGWIEEFVPSEPYDFVLCTEILEHVPDPVAILNTAARAVANGGLIYITSPSKHWGNNTHVRGVPPAILKEWLACAGLSFSTLWVEDERVFCLAHKDTGLRIFGLTRVRNEETLLPDTLDHLSSFCNGGIFVYDDCSSDASLSIATSHSSVRGIVRGTHWDPDRNKAEYENRAALLAKAQTVASSRDWFVYIDADERIDWDWCCIYRLPDSVKAVRMKLFDFYITPEDVDKPYSERVWLGPEFREIIMSYRNSPLLTFDQPDQREVGLGEACEVVNAGYVRHYGKAVTVDQWEKKCLFYSNYFPQYAAKWAARRGKAIHTQSDFRNSLIRWDDKDAMGILLTPQIAAREFEQQASRMVAPVADNNSALQASPQAGLKILLTNHHLLDYAGSEIFTLTLAKYLKKADHEVVVYSKFISNQLNIRFAALGVITVRNLSHLRDNVFDVAHVHHNISALEVRHRFPQLPIVFVSHGVLPFLEQPLALDIGIARYLAVSEEVRQHLVLKGVEPQRISVFRNIIDPELFYPRSAISKSLTRALVLSNRIPPECEAIVKQACQQMGVQCRFIGQRFGVVSQEVLPQAINDADIVFSLGRGVMEALMCARIPIVYDYNGGDGMVTPENLHELLECNFSGRKHKRQFSVDQLVEELGKYTVDYANTLHSAAASLFSAELNVSELVRIYHEAQRATTQALQQTTCEQIECLLGLVSETRNFTQRCADLRYERIGRDPDNERYSLIPERVFDGEFYLKSNPDVAAAVQRGEFGSGWQHFMEHGYLENREWCILSDKGKTFFRECSSSPQAEKAPQPSDSTGGSCPMRPTVDYAVSKPVASQDALPEQAQNYEQAERFVDAAQQYEETQRRARSVGDLRKKCESLVENGDQPAAVTCLEELVELAPDDLAAALALGRLRYQLGDLAGAAQQFERASKQAPHHTTAHACLASLRVQQDRFVEAEASARRVLELEPRQLDMLRLLAALAHHTERFEEAHDYYRSIVRLDSRDVEARIGQAVCGAAQGHRVLAELLLEEALSLQPDHPEALALQAQLNGSHPAESLNIPSTQALPSGTSVPARNSRYPWLVPFMTTELSSLHPIPVGTKPETAFCPATMPAALPQSVSALRVAARESVIREICAGDEMFTGNEAHYFGVGESALHCVDTALFSVRKERQRIRRILDLPCGHGRVMRYLKSAFPQAQITACDLNRPAVDFCAKTFGATPVYSEVNVSQIPVHGAFDLIWSGSLLTHLRPGPCAEFVRWWLTLLQPGGLMIFTLHGRWAERNLATSRYKYGLPDDRVAALLQEYYSTGFGYTDYPSQTGYGISLTSPAYALSQLAALPDLRLVSYHEKGWDNHQDVLCFQKQPSAEPLG
jgi:2-polyprenyl-3-methyl-5-hydroxy-6-metoxy-1,4-benzoquinol methylase/tetratricopeptide (TPR) repeat protein/glycosyltransferase involved in cell wall biosynthesis